MLCKHPNTKTNNNKLVGDQNLVTNFVYVVRTTNFVVQNTVQKDNI